MREGLVCPVICYSVNHISGEMDLLACPLQRNEGQPLPLRGHLQHDAIVNVKHQGSRAGQKTKTFISIWNSSVEGKRKNGVGGLGGAKKGAILWFLSFFCSFALLFLHLILIKCSGNVPVLTVKAHTHSCREALLGGKFFVFDPGNDRGPTARKKTYDTFGFTPGTPAPAFKQNSCNKKFKSLENV